MARSPKMVSARSSRGTSQAKVRGTSQANDQWTFGTYVRLFGLFAGVGSLLVTYDTVSVLFGREVVNLAISASVLIAIFVWLRRKLTSLKERSPEQNLEILEREAIEVATLAYHPVSARNTAMRTARDIIILRAALDNAAKK